MNMSVVWSSRDQWCGSCPWAWWSRTRWTAGGSGDRTEVSDDGAASPHGPGSACRGSSGSSHMGRCWAPGLWAWWRPWRSVLVCVCVCVCVCVSDPDVRGQCKCPALKSKVKVKVCIFNTHSAIKCSLTEFLYSRWFFFMMILLLHQCLCWILLL